MKSYIDGVPVTADELIENAKRYEDDRSGIYFTSMAATILRKAGHYVGENIAAREGAKCNS
ncbi:MAG: hypothetical protein IMZ50_01825 [Candidatus Atribacteria bacterium]|nr:hypothetical protein [Spirochaetota bacterium]MBE3117480.1 hypothetical protein [Candidatus Atribacteria bacterium]